MKEGYQNLHTHTTYCDGKQSAEDMIVAAIGKGGGSVGFSEHSFVHFDLDYSMPLAETPMYMAEIKMLREKYRDQIDVFLGLEADYFTDEIPEDLDYLIGSVHHIQKNGEHITVDATPERLEAARDKHFGGDFYTLVEAYFETISDITVKTKANIIGHFDLIRKHNEDGRLFDETHPRFIKSATDAMDQILKNCSLFEINTGAMFRMGKKEQYPSTPLLKELKKRGGEILFTSDSHCTESLYYKFDEMQELAKSCGFVHIKHLTPDGFIDIKI